MKITPTEEETVSAINHYLAMPLEKRDCVARDEVLAYLTDLMRYKSHPPRLDKAIKMASEMTWWYERKIPEEVIRVWWANRKR